MSVNAFMGDAAYDAEPLHQQAREDLDAKRTIVPINMRGHDTKPRTPHRRDMYEDFPHDDFGQRWQIESTFSQLKRLLEPHLRAHSNDGRFAEANLRVLTFNLMLLPFFQARLFYGAPSPLTPASSAMRLPGPSAKAS